MAIHKEVDFRVLTDDFRLRVEPLLPLRVRGGQVVCRKPGVGRPPTPARLVLIEVLKVGDLTR